MTTIAETDRLLIRTWNPEADAEQVFQIYRDPEVTRFLITKADSVEAALDLLHRWVTQASDWNDGSGLWAIAHKKTNEIVGTIILIQLRDADNLLTQDYEIGWHLKRSAWGNGYATEAANAILEYGFTTLKLPAIYGVAHPENNASLRVTQRLGMTPMGRTSRYYKTELELCKLENSQV